MYQSDLYKYLKPEDVISARTKYRTRTNLALGGLPYLHFECKIQEDNLPYLHRVFPTHLRCYSYFRCSNIYFV